jgi:uncharacterized protein (TIGR02466 family)
MENQQEINNVFGKPIYQSSIENYDSINKEIIPYIEKFVKEKPGRTAATTDVKGNTQFTDLEEAKDNLHKDKKYSRLFKKLQWHIKEFLTAKGYKADKFDIHITKAWATYTAKDQHIASHKHTASHFSCVYYVRNYEMGNLKVEEELASQTGLFIPPTNEYISNWNQFNFASYMIAVKTGDFVIFPSEFLHQTEINTKDEPRNSISADILLTMKQGISTEHCIPHPKGWLTI